VFWNLKHFYWNLILHFILFLKLGFPLNLKPFPCIKKIIYKKKKSFLSFPCISTSLTTFDRLKQKKKKEHLHSCPRGKTLKGCLAWKPVRSWFCNLGCLYMHGKKKNSQIFMYMVRNPIEALFGFEGLTKMSYHIYMSQDVLIFWCELFTLWLIYVLNSLYSPQLLCYE
jgi:hypothetical protein